MRRLRDFSPTGWDSKENYMGDSSHDHWFIVEICHSRDSDYLTESNWDYAIKELQADKTAGCEIHNFGHWACGWYELILIHPWRKDLRKIAEDINAQLRNYPVLDEGDYCERTYEAALECWDSWGRDQLREALNSYYEEDNLDFSEDSYSNAEIDQLWQFFGRYLLSWDIDAGEEASFNIEGFIDLLGTTQDYRKEPYRMKMPEIARHDIEVLPITSTLLDRIMRPEKYIISENQLPLF